jgi:hypothetical protein
MISELLKYGRPMPPLTSAHCPQASTPVPATVTHPQDDSWTVDTGIVQVGFADLRRHSPTFGLRNTLYLGERHPWPILIPPGVAHGLSFDDARLNDDWETPFR